MGLNFERFAGRSVWSLWRRVLPFVFAQLAVALALLVVAWFWLASWIRVVVGLLGVLMVLVTAAEALFLLFGAGIVRVRADEDGREREVSRIYGERADALLEEVLQQLQTIDPFRRMYSFNGKKSDYLRQYKRDAVNILYSILTEQPSTQDNLRSVVYQALWSNPWGNRWGDVGSESRYTGLAQRLWELLHPEP